ncbi:MAG: universal stress protein [Gallionellaceae bacterium]
MKILIPIDGSASASRALDHVIVMLGWLKETPQLFLLNVQWNLATGNVKLFINQETINDYCREQGLAALAGAREKLAKANLSYTYHISVGSPAEAITEYAQNQNIDQIVMGRQGKDSLSALLLGSVVNKLLHLTQVPVLLVK